MESAGLAASLILLMAAERDSRYHIAARVVSSPRSTILQLFWSRAALILLAAAPLALRPAHARVTTEGDIRIEYAGNSIGPYTSLDTAVMSWMRANDIHAAQLAVRQSGTLIFSHAYTKSSSYPLVTTTNTFRLASVSKMLLTAAFSNLLTAGKLTGGERVYQYIDVTEPLLSSQTPDPHAKDIISLELAEHTAGLPGEGTGDPLFEMRDIEVALGAEPLSAMQFAQYLYGQPLLSTPGFTYLYSNVGYFLLGMVVQKAANEPYVDYVQKTLLDPLGMKNWTLSPTSEADADPNEVRAGDSDTGPSVFDLSPDAPLVPFNYAGGDIIWEIAAAPADYVTNAESVSRFIGTHNVYGLGGRAYDYARDGCIPGASTWAESLTADIDFALLLNSQPCLGFSSAVITNIRNILSGM
jgi:CubicO group peptidase (beta-lactamase class C family)